MDIRDISHFICCKPASYKQELPVGVFEARGGIHANCDWCNDPLIVMGPALRKYQREAAEEDKRCVTLCEKCYALSGILAALLGAELDFIEETPPAPDFN